MRRYDRTPAAVSLGAIALPFALGVGLAALLYGSHDTVGGEHVRFVPFALFVGTALSITAFPVLVRIVDDRGMRGTVPGEMSIASAALQDVAGWLLLEVALAAHAGDDASVLIADGCRWLHMMRAGCCRPASAHQRRIGERVRCDSPAWLRGLVHRAAHQG